MVQGNGERARAVPAEAFVVAFKPDLHDFPGGLHVDLDPDALGMIRDCCCCYCDFRLHDVF